MFLSGEVFPSTARTAAPTATFITLDDATDVTILIDVTAVSGTISLALVVEELSSAGAWVPILSTAGITTVTQGRLTIGSNATSVTNVALNAVLPSILRVRVTHSTADTTTYSVNYRAR